MIFERTDSAINNVSACSVLFLSTTGLLQSRGQILEYETQSSALKVGSHDPIFSSNYSSIHFLRQQLDVWTPIFDKFPTFLCIG